MPIAFPFGVRAASTPDMHASADAVSDLLAASSNKYRRVRGSPSDASVSSAAKPAGDELEPCALASESMTPTLPDVLPLCFA